MYPLAASIYGEKNKRRKCGLNSDFKCCAACFPLSFLIFMCWITVLVVCYRWGVLRKAEHRFYFGPWARRSGPLPNAIFYSHSQIATDLLENPQTLARQTSRLVLIPLRTLTLLAFATHACLLGLGFSLVSNETGTLLDLRQHTSKNLYFWISCICTNVNYCLGQTAA